MAFPVRTKPPNKMPEANKSPTITSPPASCTDTDPAV